MKKILIAVAGTMMVSACGTLDMTPKCVDDGGYECAPYAEERTVGVKERVVVVEAPAPAQVYEPVKMKEPVKPAPDPIMMKAPEPSHIKGMK
jgi:hypothetical protein